MDSKMLVSWKMKVEELLKAGRKEKFGGKAREYVRTQKFWCATV